MSGQGIIDDRTVDLDGYYTTSIDSRMITDLINLRIQPANPVFHDYPTLCDLKSSPWFEDEATRPIMVALITFICRWEIPDRAFEFGCLTRRMYIKAVESISQDEGNVPSRVGLPADSVHLESALIDLIISVKDGECPSNTATSVLQRLGYEDISPYSIMRLTMQIVDYIPIIITETLGLSKIGWSGKGFFCMKVIVWPSFIPKLEQRYSTWFGLESEDMKMDFEITIRTQGGSEVLTTPGIMITSTYLSADKAPISIKLEKDYLQSSHYYRKLNTLYTCFTRILTTDFSAGRPRNRGKVGGVAGELAAVFADAQANVEGPTQSLQSGDGK